MELGKSTASTFKPGKTWNVYTLKSLSIADSEGWYRDIGKEWQDIRPTTITHFSGFANETDATVRVGGPSREFSYVRYVLQFKCENGEWRIASSMMDL